MAVWEMISTLFEANMYAGVPALGHISLVPSIDHLTNSSILNRRRQRYIRQKIIDSISESNQDSIQVLLIALLPVLHVATDKLCLRFFYQLLYDVEPVGVS